MAEGELPIRPGEPEDAPAIVDFQLRMARETEELGLDLATVSRGVAAVFADPAKGTLLDGRARRTTAVGCLLTTFEWSDWRNGVILWIQSVYVVPGERGRGVYRALYERVRRQVDESADLKGIRLYVEKRNAAARQVYERLGMTREHYDLFEWLKP